MERVELSNQAQNNHTNPPSTQNIQSASPTNSQSIQTANLAGI